LVKYCPRGYLSDYYIVVSKPSLNCSICEQSHYRLCLRYTIGIGEEEQMSTHTIQPSLHSSYPWSQERDAH
jgi:hypothetical protein